MISDTEMYDVNIPEFSVYFIIILFGMFRVT